MHLSNYIPSAQPTLRVTPACLASDMRVLVWKIGYVASDELAVGNQLVVPTLNSATERTTIRSIRRYQSTYFVRINGHIDVTEGHPFRTPLGTWNRARNLVIGDTLITLVGLRRVETIDLVHRNMVSAIDLVTDKAFIVEGFVTIGKSALPQG